MIETPPPVLTTEFWEDMMKEFFAQECPENFCDLLQKFQPIEDEE